MRPAGRASEESDDHLARPEAHASAQSAMTFGPGPCSGPSRQSIVTASADETAQSGGSVERSGIEHDRRRRDAKLDVSAPEYA
ncbi:hypothetical protein ATE68_05645 [Sphingopyxis sp. H038]|nr:hypothetical protein ATE78_20610 [Sphingopyxis sp. H012]KTE07146.1 hypothetical protein ATE70_20590 [Sphingopyxis sp. H053]KTE09028.1 hypothetical protein ATE76_14820 [Sphingopyxis sp. H093]KTE36328.1 hypothetical protein ATE68_05645 [Sphingopyxis sp. H038]KTE40506.1 hypothetical protein ATE73_16725 [Sphingopyxis sp. H077]KTE40599.1 hypothetical protein ATE77_19310 [Sphingopyxis sp. H005]KTE66167.1 hypothetical protein ATE74_14555 [Sphingopyxis sp. H085]